MTAYAHSLTNSDPSSWETLSCHLALVARLATARVEKFGAGEIGAAVALLHDFGKIDPNFQARLHGGKSPFDHAAPGAALARRLAPHLAPLLAPVIAGHHTGLMDAIRQEAEDQTITPWEERLGEADVNLDRQIKLARAEGLPMPASWRISPPIPKLGRSVDVKESASFSAAFFTRMVFSALVDADRLATEEFYNKAEGKATERGFPDVTLEVLKARLDAALIKKMRRAPSSPVNAARAEILASVRARAADPQGIFTLTVPTGGGKTLATLAFALDHAVQQRRPLDRVIVVIPYTSVVEQTAEAYREALGDLGYCVLEHHGAFDDTQLRAAADEPEMRDKLRQAQENWDAPIIVTTAVQFFESLFHNKTSRCRKLHQISRSVVVLDEVQTLPLQVLRPAIWALDELARNYRTSLVLSTATQPAVLETGDAERSFAGGLTNASELMPDPARLFQILKRVEVKLIAGKLDDEALAYEIEQREQVLTILNTRRHARELFRKIKAAGGATHLSTMMCAAHRSEVLAGIRADLKSGKQARVVATSLIEAGVDIDFPCVFRAEAGLDQIAQAAGRCNREGHGDPTQSVVYVFEIAGDHTHVEMSQRWSATKEVWRKLERGEITGTLLDPPAIEAYFRQVYWQKGHEELDKYGILACLGRAAKPLRLPMETIARKFRMIDSPLAPVLIGWDDRARKTIEALRYADRVGGIARQLQRYLVNIPVRDRAALIGRGAAEVIRPDQFGEQFVVLRDMNLYRNDVGLDGSDPTAMEAGDLIA